MPQAVFCFTAYAFRPRSDAFCPFSGQKKFIRCYGSEAGYSGGKEDRPMIITIRVTNLDGALIKRYASFHKETVTSLLKRLIMDEIEKDYRKLIAEFEEVES